MDKLFLTILNMSLTGAFVIAAICLARLTLKKAPKVISYCLWAVAGFRLVFPFSIESVFSLIPFKAQTIPPDIAMQPIPRIDSGIPFVNNAVSSVLPAATPTASINPLQIWTTIGAVIWLIGVAVMLIYGIVSFVILKRNMREVTYIEVNIYETENIKSPFVLGIFRPRIYLPIGLSEQERSYIILHEQTHIRRRDHIIKFAAYFILCLHWFNPLAWVAFLLMGGDMEMSCDEHVLKEMGSETIKNYSMSLLSLATERRIIGGTPLAFGEGGIKKRIKNVLNFKKTSRVIIVAAVALVAVLSAGFAVNQINDEADTVIPEITATETIDGAQAKLLQFGYSWYDGKDGVVADAIPTWQGEFPDENTLVIDGEMGQNMIDLSAVRPLTASYTIYRLDGTVYDDGTREVYSSLSPRLYWTDDKTGIGIVAPFGPGEYIYEVTLGWENHELKVTYGFKIIMTGKRNAYDEALDVVWNHNKDALSVSLKGTEILPKAEYAGSCYVFEIEQVDGIEKVAVSKEKGIYFTYSDGVWVAFTGTRELEPTESTPQDTNLSQRVEDSLNIIISSPLASSNPQDYINAHREEYENLTAKYPDGVLEYLLSQFEAGNSDGLRGQIMMHMCKDMLGLQNNVTDDTLSPQEWYKQLSIISEITLPDFKPINPSGVYDGEVDRKVYGGIFNSAILKKYSNSERGFIVYAPTIYGAYEESGKLKAFVTVYYEYYRLYGNTLESTGGAVIPGAIVFAKDERTGGWAFEEYFEIGTASLPDGMYFNNSIQKLCVMPVSGEKIKGLAEKMNEDYVNESRQELLMQSLKEHLLAQGQTGVSLKKPGGEMIPLT